MVRPNLSERGVVITGIKDPLLQSTARVVEIATAKADKKRGTSSPASHRLTREDLDRTLAWLETRRANPKARTPLDKLSAGQLERLTGAGAVTDLRELDHLVAIAEAARVEEPCFIEIPVDELVNPAVATCAAAIALHYSTTAPRKALTIGQLNAAYEEIKQLGTPGFTPSAAFDGAAENPEFNLANVEALNIYMRTGMGGITSRGSIEGSGYQFDRVFRLPRLPQIELKDNKPFDQQPDSEKAKYLSATIGAYEAQFDKTGYDRIYVVGDDEQLYVAVHDEGSIRRLSTGATLAFTDPLRYHDANATWQNGRVARIVDVNSTWKEASFGLLGRILSGWASAANSLFQSATERPFETLTAVSGKLPSDPSKIPTGTSPWLMAAGVAGIVTAIGGAQNIGPAIAIGAAGVLTGTVGLSVWNVYRTGKDVTPFLAATGHVINSKALRADDI